MTDLTELLREAEMQQINLQTEVQLQKNLAFFKEAKPELYNQFHEYSPEKLRLLYTEEGYLNLVNYKHNNLPVYPENPVDNARKVLQHYIHQPVEQKCAPGRTPCVDEETNAHLLNANKMVEILTSEALEKTKELPASVNLMLMLGIGLGYHLEGLFKATEIRNLCIIEPEADIFYASAHAIDWQPIIQHFSQPGHSLELIVGTDQETYINQFNTYLDRIGGFNIVNPFIFRHLTNKALEEAINSFSSRIIHKQIFGLGFFDDEQVGLAHTIKNTLNHIPILHDHVLLNKTYLNKPAFIIANGPSLDQAEEFLQANQDRGIIFSCGTALGALTKMGIKPDFHIEQERPKFMLEWIKNAATKEERKGITLLALNTVHPEVFELFDQKAMAMKAKDLGTHYITQHIKQNKQVINFSNCNPTVSNCAMAYASALGFEKVYFFGLDLGYPAGDQHHSALSKHYEIKKSEENTLAIAKPDSEKDPTVAGNFGGTIITNTIFMSSKAEIEAAIKNNKAMHCFNTSQGALIEGAQPLQVKDLKISSKPFNKKLYTDKIYQKYFSSHLLKKFSTEDVENVFRHVTEALSALRKIAETPVNSRQQGMDMLASLHAYITALAADKKTQYTATLLKGSVATFTLFLGQALHRTNDKKTNISLYKQCLQKFFDFVEQAKEKAESDLLREDVTSHNLEKILTNPIQET